MQNQNYRTFIGIPVKVGDRFLEARSELMKLLEDEKISWVDPDNYHVTIRFLGDVDVSRIGPICDSLDDKINTPRKMHIKFSRPGSFGPVKNPRVVWVGFEQGPVFESLRHDVDLALEACGFQKADKPLRVHLTLGRVRSKLSDMDGYYRAIKTMETQFGEKVWLDKIVFYRSVMCREGPVYTPLFQKEFLPW